MKPSFWKALEALGAHGSALCNWQRCLGDDWDACAGFLKPTGRSASTVIDPDRPPRRLELMVTGEEDFVAVDDDASMPPIPFKAAEVAEIRDRFCRIHEDSMKRAVSRSLALPRWPEPKMNQCP